MIIKKIAAAFVSSLLLAGSANAALLLTTGGSAANTVVDYSGAGRVSFDLDLANFSATTLRFVLEEEDLEGPLSLNALVRNLSGHALNQFHLRLQGIAFGAAGSVTPTFGAVAGVRNTADYAGIQFSRPEWAEFHIGNPTAVDGKADWLLDTRGLRAGDSFVIRADIPEPATLALLLPMLCMASLMAARRSKGK